MNNETKRYLELAQQIQTEFTDIDGVDVWVSCYDDFVSTTFMGKHKCHEILYSSHANAIEELKSIAESLK